MSMTFNMVGGGGSGIPGNRAVLVARIPSGSTVTATKGGVTLTPMMWVSETYPDQDIALFVFTPAQFDSINPWTITATDGTNTTSTTIFITTNKEYEITLTFDFYLIKDGVLQSGISFPVSIRTGRACTVTAENGYQRFSLTYSGGARTDNMIDVSNFSALYADIQPGGDTIYAPSENRYPATIGLMQTESASNFQDVYNVLSHKVSAATNTRQTLTLDLSSVTGTYNVAVTIQNSSSTAYCDVYNLWFE